MAVYFLCLELPAFAYRDKKPSLQYDASGALLPGELNDSDPHMTGLPELTQEELEWQNKHMIRVKKVKLNKIGLERINNWRKQKAEDLLTEDEAVVVEKGKEVYIFGRPHRWNINPKTEKKPKYLTRWNG